MTNEGRPTAYATPWAEQLRDYSNSLKEFGDGDDLVRELNGDLRKVSFMDVENVCALDANVVRARYWSRTWPFPGTCRELGEVLEKETHKTCQCKCWTKKGEKCMERFETHKARLAHAVHALSLCGTHGLRLYFATMTFSNVCPMCEFFF